ncbi:hypothetical protein ACP70R_038059 [Stipagrostis hirtigluma subsp. patula]
MGRGNEVFSIEVHHGGFFVGQGTNRAYVDGKVDWFDHVETDTWSPLWIEDFATQLGYEQSPYLKTYWLLPGKTLEDGLRIISSDEDTLVMASIVEKVKTFVLYFDHDDNIAGLNWDDIVANPIATLPEVLSPSKFKNRTDVEQMARMSPNVRTLGNEAAGNEAGEDAPIEAEDNTSSDEPQVQDRDILYVVDIAAKQCDCRRWDLTGIPCNHAIACLRHERIPAESVIPHCYSSDAYLDAYKHPIWPCKDKSTWENVGGPQVLPPVYEKKVGRPPKSRRKQPFERQGKNGPTMSRHGIVITCSCCGVTGHNSAGCEMKKAGIKPKLPTQRRSESICQPATEPLLSQLTNTMLSQMDELPSQTSRVELRPLPDSLYISANRPAPRPVPPTTATKEGRARIGKRKAPTEASTKTTGTKKSTSSKKK